MSALDEEAPSLAEVINLAIENAIEDISIAMPGKVVAYDSAKQVADVRPLVRRWRPTTDGGEVARPRAVVPHVPVCWPGGGGYFLHCPLAVGDDVLLVCGDADWSAWWESASEANPVDRRRHHLAHAFAIPVLRAQPAVIAAPSATGLQLGSAAGVRATLTTTALEVGGSSDAAALASVVDALLAAIAGWTPVANDGGAALKTALAGVLALPTSASTRLKTDG